MSKVCIILAGGLGTRLRTVVSDVPKCLAPINDVPFLFILMSSLQQQGIDRFVLSLGYQADKVLDILPELRKSFDVSYVTEPRPLGTGGAIKYALERTDLNEAFVVNGDTYLDGDLKQFFSYQFDKRIGLLLVSVDDATRFGRVDFDDSGRVFAFREKGHGGPGIINAGCYFVSLDTLLQYAQSDTFSFEEAVLTPATLDRMISGVVVDADFIDIGIPSDYYRFVSERTSDIG